MTSHAPYHSVVNTPQRSDSSQFITLAGREIKLTHYELNGATLPDPAQLIHAHSERDYEQLNAVRDWIRSEFNIPASIRAFCTTSFLRVFTNEQFFEALRNEQTAIAFGEHMYDLHWQSRSSVAVFAPLIAVSFRVTSTGERFAVAQVWAARRADGKGF